MRSKLIFGTTAYVSNRYLLTMLASKATRKLHRPNSRIQDTANDVFARLSSAKPMTDVPCAGNLRQFPRAAPAEPPIRYIYLKRSVV